MIGEGKEAPVIGIGGWVGAMSAGICGKRLGLEEVFGSPSSSAPKRFRFSSTSPPSSFHGSVDRFSTADLVADRADKVLALLRIFPSMDRKV